MKPAFQDIILTLQRYWGERGCALLQPYDMEVGAGTSHTATFLRALELPPLKEDCACPLRMAVGRLSSTTKASIVNFPMVCRTPVIVITLN